MEEKPAHQLIGNFSIPFFNRVFVTSQVVQDFFHQQYDLDLLPTDFPNFNRFWWVPMELSFPWRVGSFKPTVPKDSSQFSHPDVLIGPPGKEAEKKRVGDGGAK